MWRQGEHVCIIGMTGCGKTTLAESLLKRRRYKLMLVTKPDTLLWNGWKLVKEARNIKATEGHAYRLWPEWEKSKVEFKAAFEKVWNEGGWTLYLDELYHIEHAGLKDRAVQHLTQGRSKHVTVVAGVQRPAWVTRFVFSETTHIYCFRLGDDEDRTVIGKRLGKTFAREVESLKRFEFAYLNKQTGNVTKGTAKSVEEILK